MKILTKWLKRKKASLCILAGICSVSLFVIINSDKKININTGGAYVVKIRHYGIDAAEMERSVTIPLEDLLFSIPGIMSVRSSSENSLSSVYVDFRQGTAGSYEAVRDAAQRVYEMLPSSAQRPEILSSGSLHTSSSRIPVWSSAVISDDLADTAQVLKKIVKPRLESLKGAGEVIVSGAGLKEIYIILDQEKLGVLGLEPSWIAGFLGMNDSVFSGGTVIQSSREIIVTVDGRYSTLEDAIIPLGNGRYTALSNIAHIIEQEREPDIHSRLNGKKAAGIAIMGQHGADLRRLSSDIKKELASLQDIHEYVVLSDLGAEENTALNSVFTAALSGAAMVALISFLLSRKNNAGISGLFCAISVPVICLISVSVLFICGFSPGRLLLAGISAGAGTAIDAVILCSEKLRKCKSYKSASVSLSSLTGPLLAGGATTVAALIPLSVIDDSGAKIIASAIAVVTIVSLITSLTLLPPLLLWGINYRKTISISKMPQIFKLAGRWISNKTCRLLASGIIFCTRSPVIVLTASIVITLSAIFLLFLKGADTSNHGSEDSVYAQVEFDAGLLAEEVDRLLASYSLQVLGITGVKNIETGARTGSGSVLVSFDRAKTNSNIIRDSMKQINVPGGFVFFHENSSSDNYWEIFIYGADDKKCRELAEELALNCASHPLIRERILNFKQSGKKLILTPNRDILSELKIDYSSAASRTRAGVYGPVAYKRIDSGAEIDVRLKTAGGLFNQSEITLPSIEETLGLLVLAGNEDTAKSLRIDSLMSVTEDTEPSSIRRDKRRKYASITISTRPMDPRRVKKELSDLFTKLDLPPGYSIEFDPEAIRQSRNLSFTVLSLVMAILFCYMIIASINESLTVPLLVLSAIPPSLAIPAICLAASGSSYNLAVACAFIAVSGMTVNASILCVDGIRSRKRTENNIPALCIYLALRKKLPALLSTTGTTVAGAIPFLFLTEGANTLIRTLSLTCALGVASSCFCSITVTPSLLSFSQKYFSRLRRKQNINWSNE
ncbi:MAG: efflux RND transporter permease subunit [Treponema sp.]|nr:efflux RND transporter permease subunit [Treponema sp.]